MRWRRSWRAYLGLADLAYLISSREPICGRWREEAASRLCCHGDVSQSLLRCHFLQSTASYGCDEQKHRHSFVFGFWDVVRGPFTNFLSRQERGIHHVPR